jgi:hypothetical protein
MDISKLTPEDLFGDGDSRNEYLRGTNFFFNELVRLNTNIAIVEQVIQFPFELFFIETPTFFRYVIANFMDMSLIIITRLATDNGKDVYTLRWFKNRVVRKLIKPEYKELFQNALKEAKFDKRTHDLLEQARRLRSKYIAHLSREPDPTIPPIDFEDLKILRDRLNSLLEALTPNRAHLFLPFPYYSKVKNRSKSDIEEILDRMAETSHILHMPEKNPVIWRNYYEQLTESEIGQFNFYRKKFGLPEV